MSGQYRESCFKEIIERGIYWMANSKLADEYVKELKNRGHEIYVIHGLGNSGVKDVIFSKSKIEYLKELLRTQKQKAEKEIEKINEAFLVLFET